MLIARQSKQHRRLGATVVETAVVLTVLMCFIFAIIEFGRFVMARMIIDNAAREGARYAIVHTDRTSFFFNNTNWTQPPDLDYWNSAPAIHQNAVDSSGTFTPTAPSLAVNPSLRARNDISNRVRSRMVLGNQYGFGGNNYHTLSGLYQGLPATWTTAPGDQWITVFECDRFGVPINGAGTEATSPWVDAGFGEFICCQVTATYTPMLPVGIPAALSLGKLRMQTVYNLTGRCIMKSERS